MMPVPFSLRRLLLTCCPGGILAAVSAGCGNSTIELEKARQNEAEAIKRLQEREAQLAESRKALDTARQGSAEGRLVADRFLADVIAADWDAAYRRGTEELRRRKRLEEEVRRFFNLPARSLSFVVSPRQTAAESGRLVLRGVGKDQWQGQAAPFVLHLVREEGAWRVAFFSLGIGEETETGDGAAPADWKAAHLVADVFLEAVNNRNADAVSSVGTKEFQEKQGGTKAIHAFNGNQFRQFESGYTCARLTKLEAVPGEDAFVGRGELQYNGVLRPNSTYTLRIVKEGGKWRVASFTADER